MDHDPGGTERLVAAVQAGLGDRRFRTAADLVVAAVHRALVADADLADDPVGPGLPSAPGPCTCRYRHVRLEADFDLTFVPLSRYLLIHVHVAGDRNIQTERLDLLGIRPDAAGLQTFLARYPPTRLVRDVLLSPVMARVARLRQLALQEAALLRATDALMETVAVRDAYDLVCLAVHSLFVSENLALVAVNETPTADLPPCWNERRDLITLGYRAIGAGSRPDVVMTCVPFRSAHQLVVTVRSSAVSGDLCNATQHATVKLPVKRFVDGQIKLLRNLPQFDRSVDV